MRRMRALCHCREDAAAAASAAMSRHYWRHATPRRDAADTPCFADDDA